MSEWVSEWDWVVSRRHTVPLTSQFTSRSTQNQSFRRCSSEPRAFAQYPENASQHFCLLLHCSCSTSTLWKDGNSRGTGFLRSKRMRTTGAGFSEAGRAGLTILSPSPQCQRSKRTASKNSIRAYHVWTHSYLLHQSLDSWRSSRSSQINMMLRNPRKTAPDCTSRSHHVSTPTHSRP